LPVQPIRLYERLFISLPFALDKLSNNHNINQTKLIILMCINNAYRANSKIKRKDIIQVLQIDAIYTSKMLVQLKKDGYIIQTNTYLLTGKGTRLLNTFSVLTSNYLTRLEKNSIYSFADYASKNTRVNSYKYKKKKGIIKEPEKSKYNKLL
jgi:predicted transcriptional regulator